LPLRYVRTRNLSDPAIAFDITPLQNSHRFRGIGTYVRGLSRRLASQADVPLEFWAWSGEVDLDVSPPHRIVTMRRFPMPAYRGAWAFAQAAMRWRMVGSRCTAVHITDPNALVRAGRRTVITTAYDLIPYKEGLRGMGIVSRTGYRSYLRALRRADQIFGISQQTADDLSALLAIPRRRIRLARPGVDLPAAARTSTTPERPYFLFLGGPNPNKNLAVLLDAMKIAVELPQELVVAGHWLPFQVEDLRRTVSEKGLEGRVRHAGFVAPGALAPLMRDATAVVVPSLSEGFGLPVAEGLAAGALVIHSGIPVLEEISGGAALVFDPASAVQLAGCLRQAVDPAVSERLRERGLERARGLTWDAAVAATIETYRSALRR
jgi:glycosyltransferase involved in cell wall biosynthesis